MKYLPFSQVITADWLQMTIPSPPEWKMNASD